MADHIYTMNEVLEILTPIVGKTLGEVDKNNVFNKAINKDKIKGIAGDVIEQSVFGYPADIKQEPDLLIDTTEVELKTTGIKRTSKRNKSGYTIEAKEPMSITAVSVDKIGSQEKFDESTLWHKLENLLFVYYLYDSNITVKAIDYRNFPIQGFQFFNFDEEDKKTLENDWKIVRDFVRNVELNDLDKNSEYPKISQLRTKMSIMDTAPKYPNPPRFRLTKNYLSTIIQEHFGKEFQPILPDSKFTNLDELNKILNKLKSKFGDKSIKEIAKELDVPLIRNKNEKLQKSISSKILAKMFSETANRIEDILLFSKFGIKSKTIVLTPKGGRTEDTKLLMLDLSEVTNENIDFEDSSLYNYFSEQKLLFTIFEEVNPEDYENNLFKGFKLISFDDDFINTTVKKTWTDVRDLILNNKLKITKEWNKNGEPVLNSKGLQREAPNFPKSRDSIVFLRGSGKDSTAKPLEINGLKMYHQFYWLKGSYLVDFFKKIDFL